MFSRRFLRIKVVKALYAQLTGAVETATIEEKNLLKGINKSYDLYPHILSLIVEVKRYAEERIELGLKKHLPTAADLNPNRKFVQNAVIASLESDDTLDMMLLERKLGWAGYPELIKHLYQKMTEADYYKEYMASETSSYEEDKELWRKLYKTFVFDNEELDALLEEQSLYWNDDKSIIDTFVLKTIKRFEEENGAAQQLLPEYKDAADMDFASRLFRAAIANADEYRLMMSECSKNWDMQRLAFMDVVIMQAAIAEVMTFGDIPLSVTLNEYVEIAKHYSTVKSGSFVNGLLDSITKKLRSSGKINK